MSILRYVAVCLLAFHQLQSGESRVPDKPRIIGGDFAERGEFKYIVVTLHDDQYYMCGGGIIDDYYVLTAAHCVINEQNKFGDKKITVVAGVTDYKNTKDPNRVEVEVKKVYVPSSYNPVFFPNDIAVLKLKESLNLTENTNLEKLSLPTKNRNLTNQRTIMAGFGYDKHNRLIDVLNLPFGAPFTTSGLLRKADIKIFSNDECQELYPKDKIYDSYVCGKMVKPSQWREYGVCNGDSGSPLVLNSKEVVGVVSWSYGCDERDVPLVYTRVYNFLDFIKNVMNGKNRGIRIKSFN